jgi:lysyl-tRNA synthetase class 2
MSEGWWRPERFQQKRPYLDVRARVLEATRRFFGERGFVEVETPALQQSPGLEPHLMAFASELVEPGEGARPMFLHTSPEFAMKKLLVAGVPRLFQLAHCFRNGERGRLHHPEFTMLEWYRAGEAYDAVIEDSLGLARLAAKAAGGNVLRFRGRNCDPFAAPERLSVAEAFKRCAGIDLACSLDKKGTPEPQALARAAVHAGIKVAPDDTWSDIFSRVLVERIEPNLGLTRPTILDRYPRTEAALARATPDDPRFAERFELYCCGVELANGFGELTDAQEQRRRFEVEMDEKARIHGERYPIDEELLAALAHMPESSGVALGFDRLVMLATGADRIDRVMWTPPPDERDGDS